MTIRRERFFCSDAARARGDDNAATAARVDVWFLLEVPAAWGRHALPDDGLPAETRLALAHMARAVPRSRTLFIRKRVESRGTFIFFFVQSSAAGLIASVQLPTLSDLASLSIEEMQQSLAPAEQPLVLVCTHGQHDSCCGRRGYPLFDVLRQRDDLDVWQCTHIGGDRFAANALVLPSGLYYGPVEPQDADALASSALNGTLFLPGFRGRSTFSRPVQAAEIFVRRETGIVAGEQIRFLSREDLQGKRVLVRLKDRARGATHHVTVELFDAAEEAFATCSTRTSGPVQQFRIVEHTVENE